MLSERLLEFSLVGAEWVLWALVGLSALSVAVMVDRAVLFGRTRERLEGLVPELEGRVRRGDWAGLKALLARDTLVRNVLRAGTGALQDGAHEPAAVEQLMLGALALERTRYEARLTLLATIGNNVPFVGLFGTVLGIIEAFHQLGHAGTGSGAANSLVMSAIGEALVATAVGILVAIPAVAAYNFFKAHIAGRARQAEAAIRALVAAAGASRA